MKVKVLSDLHLEFGALEDVGSGDVLVLAGDICVVADIKDNVMLHDRYLQFFFDCVDNYNKVYYVVGNHEYYFGNLKTTLEELRAFLPKGITLMNGTQDTYDGWTFVGTTLWSNFNGGDMVQMLEAQYSMNDYNLIKYNGSKCVPGDLLTLHDQAIDYLDIVTKESDKVFVITHHAPSLQSIVSSRTDRMRFAYASDLEDFIHSHPNIAVWAHGHTHDTVDYTVGNCRIVSNPRGYYNSNVNKLFNINHTLTL